MQDNGQSSLSAKFEQFLGQIDLTQNRREQIAAGYQQLHEKVLSDLPYVDKTQLAGAYARNTLLQQAQNVDVFVFVSRQFLDFTPSSVLNKLHKDLVFGYPQSDILQNKPCVTVQTSHCCFELIPVVYANNQFSIPGLCANLWQAIKNPATMKQNLMDADAKFLGRLIPLIKMMKVWQHQHQLDLSFEVERKMVDHVVEFDQYRQGVEQLLVFYDWHDPHYSRRQIQCMDDGQFGVYCRDTLFGHEFPE